VIVLKVTYSFVRVIHSTDENRLAYGYYAAFLPRRGPHIASHSVCLSVRPSRYRCHRYVFSSTASVTDVLPR